MTDKKDIKKATITTPMALAEIDSTLEAKNVKRKQIVAAKVICWDQTKKGLICFFGNTIRGFIPEEEVSIYPSKDKGGTPSEVTFVIRKNIIAEVIDYNSDRTEFILSRKNAMAKRVQELRESEITTAYVTVVRKGDIFGDLGSGVNGRVFYKELTECHIEDVAYLGYHVGSKIQLKVLEIQEDNKVNLSRKKLYPEYDMTEFNPSDIVKARILSDLNRPMATITCPYAYCLEIEDNPNVKGVMDSDIPLEIGSIVTCSVKKATEKGVRLVLLSI